MEKELLKNAVIEMEFQELEERRQEWMEGLPCTKIPLTKVAALGTAFEPLVAAFQNAVSGGEDTVSGLYMVTFPKGGHLARFHDGTGFLGSVLKENNAIGGGQARLNPLVCNPTMLFMAAALAGIDKKLDAISQKQQEFMDFLEQQEKSKLKGNLVFLMDILNNYKFNWDNEKYKSSNYIKVLDIRQNAEQSIIFYQEQIHKKIRKKIQIPHDKNVEDKLEEIQLELKNYQLALYLYAFSSFLEVMLLENFNPEYLESVIQKIEDYSFRYRELYTMCYDMIEQYFESSIQSHLLKGLAGVNKTVGQVLAKVPVVNRSQADENLLEAGGRLDDFHEKRAERVMKQFINMKSSYVYPFVESINVVNRLYNQPVQVLFDQENIYFGPVKGQDGEECIS